MFHKTLYALVVAAVTALPGVAQAQSEITIIQPNNRTMGFWGIHVADLLGYFEEEGVKPTFLSSEAEMAYVQFIVNGDADLAMLDGAETFAAVKAGIPIASVYSAHHSGPEGIFVPENSPINSVTELKGKTVGLASDRDLAVLKWAMAHAGSDTDGIKTAVVGDAGPTLARLFRDGHPQAFAGAKRDALNVEAAGLKMRDITPAGTLEGPGNTWTMMSARMGELKDSLCGFFRAYSKGLHVGAANLEAVAAMSRHPNGAPHEWKSAPFGYNYLNLVEKLQVRADDPSAPYGEVRKKGWETHRANMLLINEIDKEYDVGDFVSGAFTECANDFDRDEVAKEAQAWMSDPANAEYVKRP